jgi:tungstate transport system substrate-binding protein
MQLTSVFTIVVALFALVPLSVQAAADESSKRTSSQKIMLASTIGPIDAGIVEVLEAAFTKKTGIAVEHTGLRVRSGAQNGRDRQL